MRVYGSAKWLVLLGVIVLVLAVGLSRVQLDRRVSVLVGLIEVTLAALIGVFLGLSAFRKN